MSAEYKSEKSGMIIKDHRSSFLSGQEADKEREAMLRTALNENGLKKALYQEKERVEKAEELVPSEIFNAEYQQLLIHYFKRLLMAIAQYQAGRQMYHPQHGWKKIFEGEKSGTGGKMQYFFEQPEDAPYYRGFIKKKALDPIAVNANECRDNLQELPLEIDKNDPDLPVIKLLSPDQLDQVIYFADSRLPSDILDLFRWQVSGVRNALGNITNFDHPLLHHKVLFQGDNPAFIVPVKHLQYGKPEVITPDEAGLFEEHIKIAEEIFATQKQTVH